MNKFKSNSRYTSWRFSVTTTFAVVVVIATTLHSGPALAETLGEFCVANKQDTAENCACGQRTADELLTPEEQELVLRLMKREKGSQAALAALGSKIDMLMSRVDQITQGCEKQ